MRELLERLSTLSTVVICAACAIHLAVFAFLWIWARRDLRIIVSSLADFTRDLRHRSILDSTAHLSDQIEAFLADVNEVLSDPSRKRDRAALLERMNILDEKRKYLHSLTFESCYNVARSMIEAYPLAGVVGTVLAIGVVLQTDRAADPSTGVTVLVQRFGESIWATFAGLVSAIMLMFINGFLETPFTRLSENRVHVRETVAHAKRELLINAGDPS